MYLDNLEPSKVPGEVEPTEAMLAEQCHVPKLPEAADFSNILKGNAVLLEYTDKTVVSREVDPSILCVEHCDMKRDESEPHTYCKGHSESFEQYSASEGFFETDQTVDQCETSGLSQPFDECAQHCECFKTCKSSESCANHSLASKCSPCCEHCAEHLQLFQQCEPSDQQFESFDFEPNTLAVKGDSFEHCEMSDSIPEGMDHLDLLQHYEPCDQQCESFDSEPDTSIEDSEQCEMTGFITDISDSVDLLDCGTELCEYGEFQNQTECNDDDEDADYDDEYNYPPEQEEEQIDMEPINEESCTLSEDSSHPDTPVHIYLDGREDEPSESESHQLTEENSQQNTTLDVSTDRLGMSETDFSESCQDYEPTQQCATSEQCYSEETSELCTEEDNSSDCSSIETKSFETCPDESIPPNPCSDLSGESEKEAQEDSSDEQTQWDSFEDEEEIEQSNIDARIEDTMETPTLDVAVEDYFDLFDRSDYYGHVFTQTQLYISCFDGGDIHDHFYFEKVQKEARELATNANKCEEINKGVHVQGTDTCLDAPEDASEDTYEEDENPRDDTSCGSCESEEQPEAWIEESESSLAEDEVKENESEAYAPYEENCEEAEGEEDTFDGEACTFGSHESEICNKEEYEVCPSSGNEESAYAPCADNISVEGDAYEYEQSVAQNSESLATSTFGPLETHVTDCVRDDKDEPEPKDNECIACAELEPYWSLVDPQENGEMCEQGVEEYHAYQIKSIQSSVMNDFLVGGTSQNQIINGKAKVNASSDEQEEAILSLKETDLEAHEEVLNEIEGVGFAITEVIDLNLANGHFPESDDDSGFSETSSKINALDIIHSVVQTSEGRDANSTSDQSRDSEEEPSDDEYEEADCDCDHCIPPIEQVPAKPLLPRIKSNDEGKICVVIDLDETLVHSSFKPVNNADFIIPVEIDGTVHQVYVLKRPHVDEFLKRMGELFECVLFTASLAKYADPVSDLLDKWGAFRYRLFRESCVFHKGNYVKDLGRLGRDLNKVIIIDNSPASYVFHPDNAVPVVSWFDDMSDTELLDLIPFFERLSKVDDVYDTLQQQMTSS